MNIRDYLDTDKLKSHIQLGYVKQRTHNTLPLNIVSYTRKTLYSQHWDDVTCKTRGLIFDNDGEIIARPFEKFFGYETQGIPITYPKGVASMVKEYGQPVITEKINGCLGIFWRYDHHWGIATKGSFHSPHAEWATNWFGNHFDYAKAGVGVWPTGFTPVFEIICQEVQPHPIKYDTDELVLIALISNNTGEEITHDSMKEFAKINKLRVANRYGFTLEESLKLDTNGLEGLVATFPISGRSPFKLKIKFPTFLENRRKFYEALKARDEAQEKAKKQPEYEKIFDKAAGIVMIALAQCTERHEFIAYFNRPENKKYRAICVAMLDHNDETRRKLIWKLVSEEKN